jgi:hypothetical protein
MRQAKWFVLPVALCAALGTAVLAQEAPPKEAFKAVHLVTLTSEADVASLLGALDDMNAAVAKAGFPDIRYRLYKVTGKQAGSYNYLWESSWPGGAVYDKVHKNEAWVAATKKHPEMEALMKDEVYNRYVEVSPAKR